MPAPEGNQFALGNEGRPCKFNKEEEFKELWIWAQKPDTYIIRIFPALRGYSLDTLEGWARANEEFLTVYRRSLAIIGARREQKLIDAGNARPYERYAAIYDSKLHEHERAEKEHTAEVQAKVDAKQDTNFTFKVNFGDTKPLSPEILPEQSP